MDTRKWEQSVAYCLDKHPNVAAFTKNAGLGFAIPYLYNGQMHDYMPDFLVRLKSATLEHIILETKGYDPLEQMKRAAAERWVAAVNADGTYGRWHYLVVKNIEDISQLAEAIAKISADI
jgi:type III restriction enzyme